MNKKKKPQHGGARQGAGRHLKYGEAQKYYKIYVTPALHDKVMELIREEKQKLLSC